MAKNERGRSASSTALSTQARALSRILAELGTSLPHTKALEAVARLDGHKNRHVALSADEPAQATQPTDEPASATKPHETQSATPTPLPTSQAVGEATLRDNGDFAFVRLHGHTLKVTRQTDQMHAILYDRNGWVVYDEDEDANAEDEAPLDEFVDLDRGNGQVFVPACEPHEGCDMIALELGRDGQAVVKAFGAMEVVVRTTLDACAGGKVRIIATAYPTMAAEDDTARDAHGRRTVMFDVAVATQSPDRDEERRKEVEAEFQSYLLDGWSMVETGPWIEGEGDWSRPVRMERIDGPARAGRHATFVAWFAGPRSSNVLAASTLLDGRSIGRQAEHATADARRQSVAMADALALLPAGLGRIARTSRWWVDGKAMTATAEASGPGGRTIASIEARFGIQRHPWVGVTIGTARYVREPHNDEAKPRPMDGTPKAPRRAPQELSRIRTTVADFEFADYRFDDEEVVAETGGWEHLATEMRRKLYIEAEDGDEPSLAATMVVTFLDDQSTTVSDVQATYDHSGTRLGHRRRAYDLATRRKTLASVASAFQLPKSLAISHEAEWCPTGDWSFGDQRFATDATATVHGKADMPVTLLAAFAPNEETPHTLMVRRLDQPYGTFPIDEVRLRQDERNNVTYCDECDAETDQVVGCPDGREVCRECFDGGVG